MDSYEKAIHETAALHRLARSLYEDSRKNVSGRPAWEDLDPADPYDMGMRAHAFETAKMQLKSQ